MNKWLLILSVILCIFCESPASALAVVPQPTALPEGSLRIAGYERVDGALTYVQLFNDSDDLVDLKGWKLEGVAAGRAVADFELSGWLPAGGYAVVGDITGADLVVESDFLSGLDEVRLNMGVDVAPRVVSPLQNGRFELSRSSAGNYTKTSKFVLVGAAEIYGGDLYFYSTTTPLRIVSLLANPADCLPPATAPKCVEFVKLYNSSDAVIDLSALRLRIGYANDSPGITNTIQLDGTLSPGAYRSIIERNDHTSLAITASGGGAWIEDRLGLYAYPETVLSYGNIGQAQYKGLAWSYNKNTHMWQWSKPVLDGESDFNLDLTPEAASLAPCRADQYRSSETNRCRLKLVTVAKTPCMAGQYRNPETGRCKSTASAVSLTPCRAGQVRNPDTNRCKSSQATAVGYAPCGEGKERNPETNRCRTVVGAPPSAGFVPDAAQKTGEAFVGWWALGGVGMLALGRLGWEWREEIRIAITKIPTFFTGGK